MPFHSEPVFVSSDTPGVQAGLAAARIVMIHSGHVGHFEIYHPHCKAARRTRGALASVLSCGVKFPTVFCEPARKEGAKPFTLLSAIAPSDFLSALSLHSGAEVRRDSGRDVTVTVRVLCPIYHSECDRDDSQGEGRGKGRGRGRGRGSGRGGGDDLGDGIVLSRSELLVVEVALFEDRFLTKHLHGGSFRHVPSVSATEVSGLMIVPDLHSRVDLGKSPELLKAMVIELGKAFDALIRPAPVWDVSFDFQNASLVGVGDVATGFSVPFTCACAPLALRP